MTTLTAADKMNRQYRFQRHIYDATRTHYLFWRTRLIRDLNPPDGGRVVEIACGTGWNLIHAARMYPRAKFYGLDISREMLTTAQTKIAAAGLIPRVALAESDATDFDLLTLFGVANPDRIFISYALSMIPDWPAAIDGAARTLSPGGSLAIVDFGPMHDMPPPARWALRRWLKHYNVTPRDDLERVARDTARKYGLSMTFETTRKGYSAYAVLQKP